MITLPQFIGARGGAAWTPASLGADLWAWYDAGTQGGSDGVAVSQMTDYSGTGKHLATGASKPLYRSSGVNSKPSFDFTGNRFCSTTITAFTGSNLAWFIAARISTSAVVSGRMFACYTPSADWNDIRGCSPAYSFVSGGAVTIYSVRNSVFPILESAVANNSDRVLVTVFASNSITTWSDGVAGGTGSPGAGSFNFTTLMAGAYGAEYFNGMIAEAFATTATVDSTLREAAQAYLMAKY